MALADRPMAPRDDAGRAHRFRDAVGIALQERMDNRFVEKACRQFDSVGIGESFIRNVFHAVNPIRQLNAGLLCQHLRPLRNSIQRQHLSVHCFFGLRRPPWKRCDTAKCQHNLR